MAILLCATVATHAFAPGASPRAALPTHLRVGQQHPHAKLIWSRRSVESKFADEVYRRRDAERAAAIVAMAPPSSSIGYGSLLSAVAAGDAVALLAAAALNPAGDGNILATWVAFIVPWAVAAVPLGAYDQEARSLAQAARAPALAFAVAVPCGCGLTGLLQGELPSLGYCLSAIVATGLLIEAWRLAWFAVQKTDAAFNSFAAAVIGEDGGEDDDF